MFEKIVARALAMRSDRSDRSAWFEAFEDRCDDVGQDGRLSPREEDQRQEDALSYATVLGR